MTNIEDLLNKVRGDKLTPEEFVRLVTAVIENQELGKKLDDNKIGYVIRTTDEGIYARFFVDEDTANNYILNPEDPDNQPIVSIPLPAGGGGDTQYEVNLFSNTPLAIASPNRNININLAFTTQSYIASTDTWRDNSEDGTITISRKVGDGAWEVVKTVENFTRTLYAERNTNQRTINLSDCLLNGDQQIMIGATGNRTLASAVELIFDISVAEMSLINADNWQEPKIYNPLVVSSEKMGMSYYVIGSTNKSLHYKLYDENNNILVENAVDVGTYSDTESTYRLEIDHPIFKNWIAAPGIVTVEAWLESNGTLSVRTPSVFTQVMVTTVDADDILFAVNNLNQPLINWTSENVLEWALYNKNAVTGTNVRFTITNLDGSVVWVDTTIQGALNNTKYIYAPYLSAEIVDKTFDAKITAYIGTTIVYSQNVSVDNSNSFAPTANANFILLPSMRSNADANRQTIINESQLTTEPKQITAVWNNVSFEKDGWSTDTNNVKILKLFAGSNVDINYSPYTLMTSGAGLTIEFDLMTENVTDEETPIVKIGHLDEQNQWVGLEICPMAAYMYSNLNRSKYFQDIEWGEGERTHIAINIMPGLSVKGGRLNLCRMYVNGGIECEFEYNPSADSFGLPTDHIIIGGTSADISIYGIRIYKDRQLSSDQILNDCIASMSDVNEKLRLITANNIKEAGTISYELCKDKYNTLVWHGDYPDHSHNTTYKGWLEIYKPNDLEHSGTITNMEVKGQGTSAMTYYKFNGNFKHTDNSVWTDGNGVTKGNYYQLSNNSPKMKKEVGKINYASSPQSHKMGACNAFNDLHMEVLGPTGVQRHIQNRNKAAGRPENTELPRVAVEEEPFLFFVQRDTDTKPVFYCLMTWGSPKGDAGTFGYEKSSDSPLHDYLMIEGSDHFAKLTLHQVPWFADEVTYNDEAEYYMYNGEGSWDYDLGNQNSLDKFIAAFNFVYKYSTRIKMWNGTIIGLKNSQSTDPDAANYADITYQYIIINSSVAGENYTVHRYNFPTGTWVSAGVTKTNGNYDEYNVDTDLNLGLSGRTIAPGEALNIIKTARIAAFRNGASKYFDIDDMLFLMQFLKLIGASDNRAKNTYPYYDPIDETIRNAQDDLDTIFPINNQGQKQKEYWVEEHDVETRLEFATLWAGQENAMYNTFEDCYREELESMMRSIFNAINLNAGGYYAFFEKYFFSIQEYFPIVAYNENARLLYEEGLVDKKLNPTEYETQVNPLQQSRGRQLLCEKEWIKKRIVYIASYCSYKNATGGSIEFMQESASYYDEVAAMKIYLFRRIGETTIGPDGYDKRSTGSIYSQRTDKNQTRRFTTVVSGSTRTYTDLAAYLFDLGDLSEANVSGNVDFSAGKRLTRLKLGAATTPAFHPTSITGFPVNLVNIDLRNISTLTSIPSLENASKLETLFAEGTSLQGVILPQTNHLRELSLPETLTTLTLRNQSNLYSSRFSYIPTYLKDLTIGNVGFDTQEFILGWIDILKTKTLDDTYRLVADGLNWTNVAASDLVEMMAIPTVVLKGVITFDANSVTVEQLAVINSKLGTLISTGDLVLNYSNIISLNLSKSSIVGDDESSSSIFSISSLDDTKQLSLEISTDEETWSVFDETHPAEYLTVTNIHDESGAVGKTIKGTLIAPIEVESNLQYRLRATDGTKYSMVNFINVSRKNRFTGVTISGTKYLTETNHEYTFGAQLVPSSASEVPTYNWSIRSVVDTDKYTIENTDGYSRIIRISDSTTMITLYKANRNSVSVITSEELMAAKNNNTSFIVACVVTGSYGSQAESTYEVIGHPQFTPKAVQSYDPEEENYNPALIIYLKNNESTTGATLHAYEGGKGYYMTQQEAAAVTTLGTINGLTQIQDVDGVVVESWDGDVNTQPYYRFEDFDQFKYFSLLTTLPNIDGCTNLKYLTFGKNCIYVNAFIPGTIIRLIFEEGHLFAIRFASYLRYPQNVDLYIPKTANFGSDDNWCPLMYISANNVYFNGTIEEWMNTKVMSPNYNSQETTNTSMKGFDLYCKGVKVTEVDANIINNAAYPNNLRRCKSITTINGAINSLTAHKFHSCYSLQSIVLADTVTSIPEYCFCACNSLQFTTIPSHITTIVANAFSYSGASFSEIPDSVTSFGQQENMPNIVDISYPNTMSAPGGFRNCANLRSVFFRKKDGDDFVITTLPNFDGNSNLTKIGYGEEGIMFVNNCIVLPESINYTLDYSTIRGNNSIFGRIENIFGDGIILGGVSWDLPSKKLVHIKRYQTNIHNHYINYIYTKGDVYFANRTGETNRVPNFFLNENTPVVLNTGNNWQSSFNKIYIGFNSKNDFSIATNWSSIINKLVEYNYIIDPANIINAVKESDIVTTGIPLANCAISINNGTATITCVDPTFTSAIPIKLHYRINGGAWSSPVNSGATFAVSANDVIEVYATHSLRAPSNMLKATYDGTNITYDWTDIYIAPDDVDSNGNLI